MMHELSIAYSLVELVEDQAPLYGVANDARFRAVGVRLGVLAGIVKESLLFCFETVTEGTRLQGATLEIEELPVTIFCTTCNAEQTLPGIQHLRCPVCNTPSLGITSGKELELSFIEIEDCHHEQFHDHLHEPSNHADCAT